MLGGSFNPPHRTHVTLAREALRRLPIDELRAIPSGDHPHKQGRDMAAAEHRVAVDEAVLQRRPALTPSDESPLAGLNRGPPPYQGGALPLS